MISDTEQEAPEATFEMRHDVADTMLDAGVDAKLPVLPDAVEAKCYLLIKREDVPQQKIAAQLGITQGAVSKAYRRACRKIDDLINRGLVSRDRLELELRRGVGLAPRT